MALSTAPQLGRETVCVGIIASDPLRSIGLQSILEEGLNVRTVILPDDSRPRGQKINVLIIDQNFNSAQQLIGPLQRTLLHMPGVAVVLVARGDFPFPVDEVLAAGAKAVLPENAQISEIRACIRAVLKGKTWTPRERPAPDGAAPASEGTSARLALRFTPKEREVMHWLAQGRSNREIATTMGIDEATVKAHLGRMLRKADASNRVELTLRALAEQNGEREGYGLTRK